MSNGAASVPTITDDELSQRLAVEFPDLVWDVNAIATKLTELANRYPGQLDRAKTIAAQIAEDNRDAGAFEIGRAVESALRTIKRDEVKVFLSFKMTDQGKLAAEQLAKSLRSLTAGRLDVTWAAEFQPGKDWSAAIRNAVEEATWFILMLPERSEDYDWILFETGMFRSTMTLVDRLICVHHPMIELPPQIGEFEHVEATVDDLQSMLRELVVKDDAVPGMPALNPNGEDLLEQAATKITEAIVPPKQARVVSYHGRLISLRIDNADECDPTRLASARIVGGDRFERIFDRSVQPETFGELVDGVVSLDPPDPWIGDLCTAIQRAAKGMVVNPIQSTFVGADLGRVFRPVLHRTDRFSKHGLGEVFHIVFLEDDRVISDVGIPKHVRVMALLVRQAFRFQWEILNQYCRPDLTENDVESLEQTIESIEADVRASELDEQSVGELVVEHFGPDEQRRIGEMHAHWGILRREDGTGKLDVALKQRDTKKVEEILGGLIDLSNQYMAIITCEFHKMSKNAVPKSG
jgi:hypothetical protein